MQQKITVPGSTTIAAEIELDDEGIAVVYWECRDEGAKSTETAGRVPYAKLRIKDLMILTGAEAAEMRDRILANNNTADLHVINGNGADASDSG